LVDLVLLDISKMAMYLGILLTAGGGGKWGRSCHSHAG
jgi:hypothetical protein